MDTDRPMSPPEPVVSAFEPEVPKPEVPEPELLFSEFAQVEEQLVEAEIITNPEVVNPLPKPELKVETSPPKPAAFNVLGAHLASSPLSPQKPGEQIDINIDDWQSWVLPNPDLKLPWSGMYNCDGVPSEVTYDHFEIDLADKVTGSGSDETGPFTIKGAITDSTLSYDLKPKDLPIQKHTGTFLGDSMSGAFTSPSLRGQFKLFPELSQWTGIFQDFAKSSIKQDLELSLNIDKNGINGSGKDDTGVFIVKGVLEGKNCNFVQHYICGQNLMYKGRLYNGNVIKGGWRAEEGAAGGKFRIN